MDNPDTLHGCPVCGHCLALKDVERHIAKHRRKKEIPVALEEQVFALVYLAQKVLVEHPDFYKSTRAFKKNTERNRRYLEKYGSPESRREGSQNDSLPEYQEGRDDLWNKNRPLSGGGGPGTGKKR